MKTRIEKRRVSINFFLLLFCTSLFLLAIWNTPQTVSKRNSVNNVIKNGGDYSLLQLGENDKIKQKFSIKGNELDAIELILVGFSTNSEAKVIVSVYDNYSVFEKKEIPLSQFKNGEFTKIDFDETLSLRGNKLYTLELNVEHLEGEEAPRVCYYYDSTTNDIEDAWISYNEQSLAGSVLASKYDFCYDYISNKIRSIQWMLTIFTAIFVAAILLIIGNKEKFSGVGSFLYSHEKLLFGIVTLIVCTLYLVGPMIHTIPWTVGWGEAYVDLMDAGKFPYRDFYYYMPPADLVFTWILWRFSFRNLFVYSCYRLIERLLILAVMYYIISKFSKPLVAAISTFFGCVILSAVVFDLIGDYNQSSLLYIEVLCVFLIQYMHTYYTCCKSDLIKLFAIGLCVGISFLLKQPLFIAEALFTFCLLTAFFVKNNINRYFLSLLITIGGMLIPIFVCMIVLFLNNALFDFINQVFLTNSKGNLGDMLLVAFKVSLKWRYILFLLFVFLLISVFKCYRKENDKKSFYIIIAALAIWVGLYYESYANDFIRNSIFSKMGGILSCSIVILFYFWGIDRETGGILKKLVSILLIALPCLALYFMPSQAEKLYGNVDYFSQVNDFVNLAFWLGVSACFYSFNGLKEEKKGIIFAALGSGIMYLYMHAMGATDRIPTAGGALLCAIIVAIGLEYFHTIQFRIILLSFCIIISLIGMAQKVINSYSWWGWSETRITQDKQYEIDIPGLRGYRVDLDTKTMYENMYEVIKNNTDADSTIYGFPYVKIFNVLLNNANATWFVPVPFYDVCSDYYAKMDAENLENDPPDIVVWCDIPNCMETHELIFRNGNLLGQRDIQKWFSEQVSEKKYILVGQHNNLFIYKKYVKGEKVFKNIQDKTAVNQTVS